MYDIEMNSKLKCKYQFDFQLLYRVFIDVQRAFFHSFIVEKSPLLLLNLLEMIHWNFQNTRFTNSMTNRFGIHVFFFFVVRSFQLQKRLWGCV